MRRRARAISTLGLCAALVAGCIGDTTSGEAWTEQAAFVSLIEAATELNTRSGNGLGVEIRARDMARYCGERGHVDLGVEAIDAYPDEDLAESMRYDLVVGLERGGYEAEAYDVAFDMEPSRHRDRTVEALSYVLALRASCDAASELVLQMSTGPERDVATREASMCLARAGRYEEATALAESIAGDDARQWAQEDVLAFMLDRGLDRPDLPDLGEEGIDAALLLAVESISTQGRCDRAVELTRQIHGDATRARALVAAGICLVDGGADEPGDALLAEAEALELGELGGCATAHALVRIGRHLLAFEMRDRARDRGFRAVAVGAGECLESCHSVSVFLGNTGAVEESVELAVSCPGLEELGRSTRAPTLQAVAYTAALAGRIDEARRAIAAVGATEDPGVTITSAATGLHHAGRHDEALVLLGSLPARPLPHVRHARRGLLGSIQQYLMGAGLYEEATALVEGETSTTRDELLIVQALTYAHDGEADAALAAATAVGDAEGRFRALESVVSALLGAGRLDEAQRLIESVPPEYRHYPALALTSAHMERGDVAAALSVALLLETDADRSSVLLRLAGQVDAETPMGVEELDLLLRITGDGAGEDISDLLTAE